eukprot:jgi/Hompol1/4670/HPOL_003807-RA
MSTTNGTVNPSRRLRVGVLALQGAFSEHINILTRLSDVVESATAIKTAAPLTDGSIDALILPGGESTTIALIAERNGLMEPLREWVRNGKPIWGTCAGMILLADSAQGTKQGGQALIGGLHVQVQRNAFGQQIDSFIAPIHFPAIGSDPIDGVFIRAPVISEIDPSVADKVEVIARVPSKGNCIVAVRQGHIIATSFHPELTQDTRFHKYFVDTALDIISASSI